MHTTRATTECHQQTFLFQGLGSRRVEVDFSGGHLSRDGGSLLWREMDRVQGLCERLAGCFTDFREEGVVEHELTVMLRQRILGLARGYEDINDHDLLRLDPLLAAMCGRADVLGEERPRQEDKGRPLAGKSTLNRLELGAQEINARTQKIQARDDPLHGQQEGRGGGGE
ncbi:MAG: transposase [Chthoniobacteraceae bacterium]